MSQADESVQQTTPGKALVRLDDSPSSVEWADLRSAASWAQQHSVLLGGILLIVAQLAWKAQFLSHLYFRQDDFHVLDMAAQSSFNWSYLTFVGAGHLIIGARVIAWVISRISLYNWALASGVSLAFVAGASVAALRLMRTLFGERPAILIPLAVYLLSPLTLADLGWWSSAMESAPLQLATFMVVTSHVWYVRTGRTRHLAAAVCWLAFGLLFFEKALVLPLLLFAITAAFLMDRRALLDASFRTLTRFWKAWLAYGLLLVAYVIVLLVALHTSAAQPQTPGSVTSVLTFAFGLVKETFLPGAIGGPWQWFPVAGGSYAFSAPPAALIWLSAVVAAAVIGASLAFRRTAARAWVILAGWVILADMLPVIVGRLNAFSPAVLGLETRYLADAVPVLAICVGLAFWPLAGEKRPVPGYVRRAGQSSIGQHSRTAAAALVGVFVFSAIWSAQAYENVTTGSVAATYIENATLALAQAPRGTPVLNRPLPDVIVEGLFGQYALASTVVGDAVHGKLAGHPRWILRPQGTIDGLTMFSKDGRLHLAEVYGTSSLPKPPGAACWPERHGQIAVQFWRSSPAFTGILRVGYIWLSPTPGWLDVQYGNLVQALPVLPGLHAGYLSVTGSVSSVLLHPLNGGKVCVGDVEAGNLGPAVEGRVLPRVSA
ncbi:MAG TPA: hypothetical protein VN840_16135 [Streptosporangiaceae bacterium]|nr:hypothetical protein [Streptosporangiaceae bacterium]